MTKRCDITRRPSIGSLAGIICLLATFACQIGWAAEAPKRVVLLHSFGPNFKPWSDYATTIRAELLRQSPWPLDIQDHSLVTARYSGDDVEGPLVEYLRALYDKHPLDLLVSIGAPAAAFVQRNRKRVFASAPAVFTAVERRRIDYSAVTSNDTVVAVTNNHRAVVENILQVRPDTKTLAVVIGDSPNERFWLADLRETMEPLANRISFIWYNQLSFEDILKRSASLPQHSAIFWELMNVDAAGVVHEQGKALSRLYAVANAPIFSYNDTFFGHELVGGPMQSVLEGSQQTASVVIRILGGENPSNIKIEPIEFAAPKFDWRQMQRWGISESRLPPGSEIHFRNPTLWGQYRLQVLGIFAALLMQTALISWLLYEHRRRHLAEVRARNSIAELTYLNRRAAAGELSATIAHEVNQPLTGIVTRASAALNWLARDVPDIGKARDALTQIVNSGHRASDIIANVRAMFKKDVPEKGPVDINELIRSVMSLVYIDLRKHGVETQISLGERFPPVIGNKVQLQQVILNLVMNAIDAMNGSEPRLLSVRAELTERDRIRVSIEDTGSGISDSDMAHIFKPLFTTKKSGIGMGLSICHSIIENHDGRIWVSPAAIRGSIFQFELPVSVTQT